MSQIKRNNTSISNRQAWTACHTHMRGTKNPTVRRDIIGESTKAVLHPLSPSPWLLPLPTERGAYDDRACLRTSYNIHTHVFVCIHLMLAQSQQDEGHHTHPNIFSHTPQPGRGMNMCHTCNKRQGTHTVTHATSTQ